MTAPVRRAADPATALRVEIVADPGALERWRDGWDRLAVASQRPFCAPAWMLAWWHHGARPGCRLRTVIVHRGDELLGVAPFFVEPARRGLNHYRILAAPWCHRAGPICEPGREREVGALFAQALADADPRPDRIGFEALAGEPAWPEILRDAWPAARPPSLHSQRRMPAPVLSLSDPGFAAWFSQKSANFRQQLRRARRKLEAEGAVFAMAETEAEVERGIAAFRNLLRHKWGGDERRDVLSPWIDAMLADAAGELLAERRFRLWTVRVDDRAISANVFLAAGGEVSYWLGGYDRDWAAQRPSLLAILACIEDAWSEGDRRVDFGGGPQPYKYRFASGEDALDWTSVVPRGRHHWRARLSLLPGQLRQAVAERLSPDAKERIRRWMRWELGPERLLRRRSTRRGLTPRAPRTER